MAWSTRSDGRDKEYIVIKHRLNDINGLINGVKFRYGYGVVDKNSKAYFAIKQLPLIKGGQEFPITHLRKLKFITRSQDIQLVYGQDVYYNYLREVKKLQEEEIVEISKPSKAEVLTNSKPQVIEETLDSSNSEAESGLQCTHILPNGNRCKGPAEKLSPSSYCKIHLLKDPKLGLYGIEIPTKITKIENKELNARVIKQLEELSR